MSGTQSTMFAVPSHAIIGKPQHFDGTSRRSVMDMAAMPKHCAPSASNHEAISNLIGVRSLILSGVP